MKILIEVRHPAHVHHFRHFAAEMQARGHDVRFMAVDKDLATELLERYGIPYAQIGRKRDGLARTVLETASQVASVVAHCRRERPDVLVGRPSPSLNLAGWMLRIPTIVFAEDDLSVAPLAGLTAYPFSRVILTPEETGVGRWEHKRIKYPGYQKLAYLHPARFTPDEAVVRAALGGAERFFLLRLASLRAHHDRGVGGMGDDVLRRVVSLLEREGRVLISAERPILPEYEPYRIRIDPTEIHHFMAYADLFVGDSQSMTMEAAMLGTPSIRYSDFAGRIGVLESLEHRYRLTTGVPATEPQRLLDEIRAFLDRPGAADEWRTRRDAMLRDKIDVTGFMVWFVEGWPASAAECRADPSVFRRFAGGTTPAPTASVQEGG